MQLFPKPHGLERGRYTVGDCVSAWPPAASADTLVVIRGNGKLLTSDKQMVGWLAWGAKSSSFHGSVAFVDARAGEIPAPARFYFWSNITLKSDEALRSSIRDAFHDLPLLMAKAPSTK